MKTPINTKINYEIWAFCEICDQPLPLDYLKLEDSKYKCGVCQNV